MITYLAQHKTIAILLLTVYFLGLVYFHDAATVVADWLKYKLTLSYYNLSLLISGLALSSVTGYFLWRTVIKHPERRMFFLWFLITILAMILALFTMMVVNMEAIHYLQYAILAVLIFPLVQRYEDAFIGATILGMVDEMYQYLVLNPSFKYFDFNDIILNMLGAGAGLLVMAAASFPESRKPRKWYRSSSYFFIGIIILLGIIISGNFPVTFFPVPVDHNGWHWFSLYRQNLSDPFWTPLYASRHYHIFRPWEGIMVMSVLTFFYARIDYFYANASRKKSII
ncbi:MAG: hypothetical protein M0Q51_15880 [Bacteroidales bacterium]|nr:hypothetical protein [Bacteroidales bacterium]